MNFDDTYDSLPDLVRVDDVLIAERRAFPRHSYPALQKVQPHVVPGMDARGRFVRCHDLSESGISFWTPVSFLTDRLTITLGDDQPVEVDVEVCHTAKITCLQDPLYLIGCRFLGRDY